MDEPLGPTDWQIRFLDDIVEILQKKTKEMNDETDFRKMDEQSDELAKITQLKIDAVRWKMELTKQNEHINFGFNTGNPELDRKLEEVVSRQFQSRNRNKRISFNNLLSEVGADTYFLIQKDRMRLEPIIMDTISEKILSVYEEPKDSKDDVDMQSSSSSSSGSDSDSAPDSDDEEEDEYMPPVKKLKENYVESSPEREPESIEEQVNEEPTSSEKDEEKEKKEEEQGEDEEEASPSPKEWNYRPTEKELRRNPFLRPDSYGNFDVGLAKNKMMQALALKKAGFTTKNFDISTLPKRPEDKSKWTQEDYLAEAFGIPYQILQVWPSASTSASRNNGKVEEKKEDDDVEILNVPKEEPLIFDISDDEEEEKEDEKDVTIKSVDTTNSFNYSPMEEDDGAGPSTSTANTTNEENDEDEIQFIREQKVGAPKTGIASKCPNSRQIFRSKHKTQTEHNAKSRDGREGRQSTIWSSNVWTLLSSAMMRKITPNGNNNDEKEKEQVENEEEADDTFCSNNTCTQQ